ncbi:MAG: flagellar biosynthetic protein FliO [Rhodocyclaceae bacterium]|nr:flagellar biosynthetic protein FliO [Rhodocyclaceae bacterium]
MLLLPLTGHAADAPALPPAAVSGDLAGSIGQMALGLGVVIAVLLVCLWLLKRLAAPRGSARGMKVLGAAPVGPRERVVLVDVAGTVLVLGVAPGRVNTLHTLDADQLDAAAATGAAPQHEPSGFAARLKTLVEARKDA